MYHISYAYIFTANTPRITFLESEFAFQVSVKRRSRWYFEGGPGRASSQHAAFHDKFNRHCATLIPPLRFSRLWLEVDLSVGAESAEDLCPAARKLLQTGILKIPIKLERLTSGLLLSCYKTNHQTQQTKIGNFNVSCWTKLTWAHAILQVIPRNSAHSVATFLHPLSLYGCDLPVTGECCDPIGPGLYDISTAS